ncbi:MAG: hypothetical protein HPY76_09220 [Anaerolineae bacterium]|nr:hypothetical protein [Anaerolineae bacterium]
MQEILPQIYIESGYPGVTLGAINWVHGLVLIDAPFRQEDVRSWRSALLNLGGGVDRLLVNLDAHLDRTLGVRLMDCSVVGHEQIAQVFRSRPLTFKAQPSDSGAVWELYENLGSVRWAPPEITFTDQLHINWDPLPLVLEYHPGCCPAAIWAVLPEHGAIFVGDAVTTGQPPFLAMADITAWLGTLDQLLTKYANFIFISGRGGVVRSDQVRQQIKWLQKVEQSLEKLAQKNAHPEDTVSLVPKLLGDVSSDKQMADLFERRLANGLAQYYQRHYGSSLASPSGN